MTDRVKVFLSYRRADTQHVAGRVGDRLSEQFELFMDIDTIPPGWISLTRYAGASAAVTSCWPSSGTAGSTAPTTSSGDASMTRPTGPWRRSALL